MSQEKGKEEVPKEEVPKEEEIVDEQKPNETEEVEEQTQPTQNKPNEQKENDKPNKSQPETEEQNNDEHSEQKEDTFSSEKPENSASNYSDDGTNESSNKNDGKSKQEHSESGNQTAEQLVSNEDNSNEIDNEKQENTEKPEVKVPQIKLELVETDIPNSDKEETSTINEEKKKTQNQNVPLKATEFRPSRQSRLTGLKKKSYFATGGIPPIGCIRCSNSYFLKKEKNIWKSTEKVRHLTHSFAFMPTSQKDIFRILHLDTGLYVGIKTMQENEIITNNDDEKEGNENKNNATNTFKTFCLIEDEQHLAKEEKELQFEILLSHASRRISNATLTATTATLVRIKSVEFNDLYLTYHKQTNSVRFLRLMNAEVVDENLQLFEISKPLSSEDENETELNIVWSLDLVLKPREDKLQLKLDELTKPDIFSQEIFDMILNIFFRFDLEKTGYAPFKQVWNNIVEYSLGKIPSIVVKKISEGTEQTEEIKLVHFTDLIETIEFIWESNINEIIIQQQEEKEEQENLGKEDIYTKMRRLDECLLTEHPFLKEWHDMSNFEKKIYDYKIWFTTKFGDVGKTGGFGLWRSHLVNIQGNFGESIFAFFTFTRWLFVLNVLMGISFLLVILPHCWTFGWFTTSLSTYLNIVFGNEYTDSWYYYGAYQTQYNFNTAFDIGFIWVISCGLALLICIIAILQRVLGSSLDTDNDEEDFVFSKNVFSSYDFSLKHEDDITLKQNSIMIRLHETLLQKLDAMISKLTFMLFIKRLIGIILSFIIGVISAVSIVGLIRYEQELILGAENTHSFGEKISVYIVPAGVSVIKILSPKVVKTIVAFEKYSAGIAFQQTFFRVFLLRMFAILVTLFQTTEQVAKLTETEIKEDFEENYCAETQIGMTLFRFVLFDIVVEIMMTQIMPTMKYCCGRCTGKIKKPRRGSKLIEEINKKELKKNKKLKKKKGDETKAEFEIAGDSWKTQFDIPMALLDVMYRQTIVWSGMYFSPMIPWLATFATMLTFYLKKRFLFNYCGRPKKALGVVKQLRFFYGMLLLAVVVAFLPFRYFLSRVPRCGPLFHEQVDSTGQLIQEDEGKTVLEEFSETADQEMPPWMATGISYCLNGIILLPLFILSLVFLFYLRRTRKKARERSKMLKHHLIEEINEKKRILKDYNIRL